MVAKALLCYGADINPINCRRQTPLDLATIAWAAHERQNTVVKETFDAVPALPPGQRMNRQKFRADSTSSWVVVDSQLQASGHSQRSTPEREGSVDRSMSVLSKDSDDYRAFAESTMISLAEETVEVKSKSVAAESVVAYESGEEILELLYSCGAVQGMSRKRRFQVKVPHLASLTESCEVERAREIENELERSVKLKDYYDRNTVLTLSEELEDNINLRMDSQASLSGVYVYL